MHLHPLPEAAHSSARAKRGREGGHVRGEEGLAGEGAEALAGRGGADQGVPEGKGGRGWGVGIEEVGEVVGVVEGEVGGKEMGEVGVEGVDDEVEVDLVELGEGEGEAAGEEEGHAPLPWEGKPHGGIGGGK